MRQLFEGEDVSPAEMAKHVANAWNRKHDIMQENLASVAGLGGRMRPSHAEELLKKRGHEIKKTAPNMSVTTTAGRQNKKKQVEAAVQPAMATAEAKRNILTRHKVGKLSVRDALPWLRKLALPTAVRTRKGRQDLLRKHFDGKKDGHQVELQLVAAFFNCSGHPVSCDA